MGNDSHATLAMVRMQQLVVARNKMGVANLRFVEIWRNCPRCCHHSPNPPNPPHEIGNGMHIQNCRTKWLHQNDFQYLRGRLIAARQWTLDRLHITLGRPTPFAQQQWTSLPRELQAAGPHTRGQVEGEASNVCLHCVPNTLWWSRATVHNVCDMSNSLDAAGIPHNGMPITMSGIVRWNSCMGATRGAGCPSRICWLWWHIGPIETFFFAGNGLRQGLDKRQWIGPSRRSSLDGRSWMADDCVVIPETAGKENKPNGVCEYE